MQRISIPPRFDWQHKVESVGLLYHMTDGRPYWDESAYYEFSRFEIDAINQATADLQVMCLKAAQHVIDCNRFSDLGISDAAADVIRRAWNEEPPSLYGRFDLACDGVSPPKLLEYNADTPTALLEAAVTQWYWLQDVFPGASQCNALHENLVAKWQDILPCLEGETLYFCHADSVEDFVTISYLRETAHQAGVLCTSTLQMEEIGWLEQERCFVDLEDNRIGSMFKLYPWEWMIEEFPGATLDTYFNMVWIEPIWKMLWSNKGLLAVLWELFPRHPNLLEAHLNCPWNMTHYVKKPLLSREGANITVVTPGGVYETGGAYGQEGFVYQALAPVPEFEGRRPIVGSWLITDMGPSGIGIRESDSPVTDNQSRFVPHIYR